MSVPVWGFRRIPGLIPNASYTPHRDGSLHESISPPLRVSDSILLRICQDRPVLSADLYGTARWDSLFSNVSVCFDSISPYTICLSPWPHSICFHQCRCTAYCRSSLSNQPPIVRTPPRIGESLHEVRRPRSVKLLSFWSISITLSIWESPLPMVLKL